VAIFIIEVWIGIESLWLFSLIDLPLIVWYNDTNLKYHFSESAIIWKTYCYFTILHRWQLVSSVLAVFLPFEEAIEMTLFRVFFSVMVSFAYLS
jgi:hypothetical protein